MSRIGAILLEFGLSFPRGHAAMKRLLPWLARQPDSLPSRLIGELQQAHDHYIVLNQRIQVQDKKLQQLVEQNEVGQLLISVPGIGNMTASQCLAEVSQPGDFKNGRNLSAWIGLVPRQHSTGGKPTLLGISERGNKHLRTLFIHGARAVLSRLETTGKVFGSWLTKLRANKPFNVVVVALANKLARIAWVVMSRKEAFNPSMI